MKICSNAVQLRGALKKVKPTKIAVAFVGNKWKNYVSPTNLKEIVLSPTLGSNPKAIEEIMNMIGPSNVYFLDKLHSKIYLGAELALIGSPNLSGNGFADLQNLEVGVIVSGELILDKFNTIFNEYKASAKLLYPTIEHKKERLKELNKERQISIWHDINTEHGSDKPPTIDNYSSKIDRIHVMWYQPTGFVYNEEIIGTVLPDTDGLELDDYFSVALDCLEEDLIEPGDWILCWYSRNDGYPRERGDVSWMHVHHVVPKGVKDNIYTKLVGQAKSMHCPSPPFALDPQTKKIIRDALASHKFPQMLSLDDKPWRLVLADAVFPQFLDYLRKVSESYKK